MLTDTQNINSWPFIEANKILAYLGGKLPDKGYVAFETGYGPSGLPHIGTFAEVLRTTMVMEAFKKISDFPTKLICFSDDFDALRSVPDNVPNRDNLKKCLGTSLTSIEDPFQKESSFGEYMNKKLRSFLDYFGFEYVFYSATDFYRSGKFDEFLIKVLQNYEKIKNVVLPTLGPERKESYSPFMPICKKSGKVLQVPVEKIDLKNNSIFYRADDSNLVEISILGGNCKLQWKPDFAMRWACLDIDFEIYGKEHLPNSGIYNDICSILGGKPPVQFFYELFLDHAGAKISKSKGNSIAFEDLIKYCSVDAISLFIYHSPKKAKKMDWSVVPKYMDEYLVWNQKYFSTEDPLKKMENPLFHIHKGNVPRINCRDINFTLLINLISTCNVFDQEFIWKFVRQYHLIEDTKTKEYIISMINYAILYYRDIVQKSKNYLKPNEKQKILLTKIVSELSKIGQDAAAVDIQRMIYKIGVESDYKNLNDYFRDLYKILLGQEHGPRMGSFIKLLGCNRTRALIQSTIDGANELII